MIPQGVFYLQTFQNSINNSEITIVIKVQILTILKPSGISILNGSVVNFVY